MNQCASDFGGWFAFAPHAFLAYRIAYFVKHGEMYLNLQAVSIAKSVYYQILHDLGLRQPECGGVLGMARNGVISAWYHDLTGKSSPTSYSPDVLAINSVLRDEWQPNGIKMAGIVHSHSTGKRVPSCGDINYGLRILDSLDTVDVFYLPILEIQPVVPNLFCYVIFRNSEGGRCKRIPYQIV